MTLTVRAVRDGDMDAITAIYRTHVLNGTASFEIEPPDIAEMTRRRDDVIGRGLPYLVAEDGGRVIGYAYAGAYRPRPAYRFTVENSIYIDPLSVRQGAGRALLSALIALCREKGCRQMIAVIGDSANTASIRLHEALGFEHTGVFRNVGFKFERWLDTVLMQLVL